jgi:hypothetical protein
MRNALPVSAAGSNPSIARVRGNASFPAIPLAA